MGNPLLRIGGGTCENPLLPMNKEQLLGEVDDILRAAPSNDVIRERPHTASEWVGRAAAALTRWDMTRFPQIDAAVADSQAMLDTKRNFTGFQRLTVLLQQARADLRMEVGLLSVVIPQGQVFDYFDELRKIVEAARSEVFFVDPYLDPDFVSRYLPQVGRGCAIRLLTGPQKIASLLPAVDLFTQQFGRPVRLRVSDKLHDRFLFVDRASCYLSGASFKDGAKNAAAVLTQITDAVQAMLDTYESLWATGKVER